MPFLFFFFFHISVLVGTGPITGIIGSCSVSGGALIILMSAAKWWLLR